MFGGQLTLRRHARGPSLHPRPTSLPWLPTFLVSLLPLGVYNMKASEAWPLLFWKLPWLRPLLHWALFSSACGPFLVSAPACTCPVDAGPSVLLRGCPSTSWPPSFPESTSLQLMFATGREPPHCSPSLLFPGIALSGTPLGRPTGHRTCTRVTR